MTPKEDAHQAPVSGPHFVALSRDLFFGMRARTVIRKMGHEVSLVDNEQKLLETLGTMTPAMVIIDFNQPVAWDVLDSLLQSDIPVIAFGAHTDVEGFRAARAAGVARVTSNGDFSRRLPDLIKSYSRS